MKIKEGMDILLKLVTPLRIFVDRTAALSEDISNRGNRLWRKLRGGPGGLTGCRDEWKKKRYATVITKGR